MQRLYVFPVRHIFGRYTRLPTPGNTTYSRFLDNLNSSLDVLKFSTCVSNWQISAIQKKYSVKQLESQISCILHNELLAVTPCHHNTQLRFMSKSGQEKPGEDKEKQQNDENKDDDGVDPTFDFIRLMVLMWPVMAIMWWFSKGRNIGPRKITEVSWQEFQHDMLAKGEVLEVRVSMVNEELKERAVVVLVPGARYRGHHVGLGETFHLMMNGNEVEKRIRQAEKELGIMAHDAVSVVYKQRGPNEEMRDFVTGLVLLGVLVIIFGSFVKSFRKFDMFEGITKAKYTRGDHIIREHKITFKEVAGLKEPKIEIMEFVEYLKNPEKFKILGAKVPKGALLLGPPGCGKTLLAKAVATEAEVPFLTMNGSEFVEMIGGLGARRMRSLFKDARAKAPCIIYIDEIDAIGKRRGGMGSEEEHTLNQLLVELDGMTSIEGVILLASTNRAEVLDKALLRSGRFDRHITIDYPPLSDRKEMYELYLKKLTTTEDWSSYVDRLAQLSPGFTGADIQNICNEAALYAARHKKTSVDHTDFEYAMERVIAGVAKKSRVLSQKELRVVAYHEAGHALVGWLLEHTDPLLKVSIVSRTNAVLGFAQYSPSDQHLFSKEDLFDGMCLALGGRAAEAIIFNNTTSGAADDLDKVTQMAYKQIRNLGMNERVGMLSYAVTEDNEFGIKPFSQNTHAIIDEEASLLVSRAYQATEALLKKNKDKLKVIAEALVEKQALNYNDMVDLIGPPPYGGKKNIISPWETTPTVNSEQPTT